MGLKFKIIFGYGILIALLIVTIYIFRKEQMNRNTLHRNEKELVHTWQLTEEICIDLLELTTEGEMVSVWKEKDYLSYTEKRKCICDTLQVLKKDTHILGLQSRIDTLCLLLEKKEKILYWIMNTFYQLKNSTDIIGYAAPKKEGGRVFRLPDYCRLFMTMADAFRTRMENCVILHPKS